MRVRSAILVGDFLLCLTAPRRNGLTGEKSARVESVFVRPAVVHGQGKTARKTRLVAWSA